MVLGAMPSGESRLKLGVKKLQKALVEIRCPIGDDARLKELHLA